MTSKETSSKTSPSWVAKTDGQIVGALGETTQTKMSSPTSNSKRECVHPFFRMVTKTSAPAPEKKERSAEGGGMYLYRSDYGMCDECGKKLPNWEPSEEMMYCGKCRPVSTSAPAPAAAGAGAPTKRKRMAETKTKVEVPVVTVPRTTNLEADIQSYLEFLPSGLHWKTAREVAKALTADKHNVNQILYAKQSTWSRCQEVEGKNQAPLWTLASRQWEGRAKPDDGSESESD